MAAGIVTITSQVDWQAFVWTPAAGVDLDTEAGTVLLAAGYSAVNGVGPGWQHPNWGAAGDWGPIEFDLGLEPGLRFALRFKCAVDQASLAAADWTDWVANIIPVTVDGHPEITHRFYFDPQTAIDNGEVADAGPWFNLEMLLRR